MCVHVYVLPHVAGKQSVVAIKEVLESVDPDWEKNPIWKAVFTAVQASPLSDAYLSPLSDAHLACAVPWAIGVAPLN